MSMFSISSSKAHSRLGRGFFEGIKIHDHHVDGLNAVLCTAATCFGIFAAMQDAAVNFRMQSLDASVEHFGEAGEVGDVFHGDAGIAQEFGGASGGDEFDVQTGELAGEIDESGLVGDAENGALDLAGLTWILRLELLCHGCTRTTRIGKGNSSGNCGTARTKLS